MILSIDNRNPYSSLMMDTESSSTKEKATVSHTDEKASSSVSSYLYIQMEYCENGTLEDLIRKGDVLCSIQILICSYTKTKQESGRL